MEENEIVRICPNCDSIELDYEGPISDDGILYYKVICFRCGTTWEEIYEFTHNDNLEIKNEK